MTAIIQQDIIIETQVKTQKEFEKTNNLIQEQNSIIIQKIQQLFQIFSSEMNMMKNDIRDVKVSLTHHINQTTHQQYNNTTIGSPPPNPPPRDSSSNKKDRNPNNNTPIHPKADAKDINTLLPPVKECPKFSGAGE